MPPEGKLHDGSLIPLSSASAYPTTEQTLAAVSMLLNGGGIGQLQDITQAFSTAFAGREDDLRSLIEQLDMFIGYLNDQTDDIIAATESLNNLVGQFAAQKPVVDKALKTIPEALAVLNDQREKLADALDQLGKFSALAADSVNQTKESLVQELQGSRPGAGVAGRRRAGADPGAELPVDLSRCQRDHRPTGCAATTPTSPLIIDLTLSRHRRRLLHRNPVGGRPHRARAAVGPHHRPDASPYTAGNPLVVPYHWDQGP